MGSTSSSRSKHAKTSANTSLADRVTAALAAGQRYTPVVLGVLAVGGALLCWGMWGNSASSAISDNADDEIAALAEISEWDTDPETAAALKPSRPPATRTDSLAGRNDPPPAFDDGSEFAHGVVTATFAGTPRPVDTGPVWLAGTIETDDFPTQSDFLPEIPSSVQPASSGPLLIPQ